MFFFFSKFLLVKYVCNSNSIEYKVNTPNKNNKHFSNLEKILKEILSTLIFVLGDDFCMTPDDNCMIQMCRKFSLYHWIMEPKHYAGRTVTIDLIFTSICTDAEMAVFPCHTHCYWVYLTYALMGDMLAVLATLLFFF